MKVKICGITDLHSAKAAVKHGADAIGLVFAESKRNISPEQAKAIAKALPSSVCKVGVFVNERKDTIVEIAQYVGLNAIQLHGDESPEFCKQFSIPVIKAFSIKEEKDLSLIPSFDCDYILVDSPRGKYYGGSGIPFNWNLLKNCFFHEKKLILAGGLNERNVVEGIRTVHPYMVDVSSGVETNGKKDFEKMKRFIQKAKKERKYVNA